MRLLCGSIEGAKLGGGQEVRGGGVVVVSDEIDNRLGDVLGGQNRPELVLKSLDAEAGAVGIRRPPAAPRSVAGVS